MVDEHGANPWWHMGPPIIGPWIGRIGKTIDIWGSPCSPTPWMLVEAAFFTVPMAAWSFYKPTGSDYFLSRFAGMNVPGTTPRFGRPHGGGKGFKVDIMAKEVVQPFSSSGPGSSLAKFGAGLLLRIGWWLTIIDLTTQGLVQWSSLAYQYAGCQLPGGGYGDSTYTPGTVALGSLSGAVVPGQVVTSQVRCIGGGGTWACDTGQVWSCSYTVGVEPAPGLPGPNVSFFLNGEDEGLGHSNWSTPTSNGTYSKQGYFRVRPPIEGPKNFSLRYKTDWTFIVTGGTFSVVGGPADNFLRPDP